MRKIAKMFRQHTNYTDRQCREAARRVLFLLAYPDANPLRRMLEAQAKPGMGSPTSQYHSGCIIANQT